MFKHLLVPIDGSELSLRAVQQAVKLARTLGARITLFTAVQPMPKMFGDPGAVFGAAALSLYGDEARAEAAESLEAAARVAADAGVVCDKVQWDRAEPHAAILEAGAHYGCDLIFMASHGRRGINALFLGSETHKVLTHGKIPVLVCR